MATTGKVKTLFADKEKTEALFPRTKVSAVSDENGVGLNVLLDNIHAEIDGLTYSDVGAAPAGYGLGESPYDLRVANNANEFTTTGWYRLPESALNGIEAEALLRVECVSDRHTVQTAYSGAYSAGYFAILQRTKHNNVWGKWEWVNPPMMFGVEYRTTKRYLGKPVYTQMVGYGALPNNTGKNVSLSVATTVTNLVGYSGSAVFGSEASAAALDTLISKLELKYNGIVRIETDEDRSGWSATFAIEYTKD